MVSRKEAKVTAVECVYLFGVPGGVEWSECVCWRARACSDQGVSLLLQSGCGADSATRCWAGGGAWSSTLPVFTPRPPPATSANTASKYIRTNTRYSVMLASTIDTLTMPPVPPLNCQPLSGLTYNKTIMIIKIIYNSRLWWKLSPVVVDGWSIQKARPPLLHPSCWWMDG